MTASHLAAQRPCGGGIVNSVPTSTASLLTAVHESPTACRWPKAPGSIRDQFRLRFGSSAVRWRSGRATTRTSPRMPQTSLGSAPRMAARRWRRLRGIHHRSIRDHRRSQDACPVERRRYPLALSDFGILSRCSASGRRPTRRCRRTGGSVATLPLPPAAERQYR